MHSGYLLSPVIRKMLSDTFSRDDRPTNTGCQTRDLIPMGEKIVGLQVELWVVVM